MPEEYSFEKLLVLLSRIPAVEAGIGTGRLGSAGWYAKFGIDIEHKLAWHVVQEFGHILNYVSIKERLPTVFKPVSPPPYLNGGPKEFLSWVIECEDTSFTPDDAAEWLEGRLPRPVEDESEWLSD